MFTFPPKQQPWGRCSRPQLDKAFGAKSTNKDTDNPLNGFCGQCAVMSYFFSFTAKDFVQKKKPSNPQQRHKKETISIHSAVLLARGWPWWHIFNYLQLKSHVGRKICSTIPHFVSLLWILLLIYYQQITIKQAELMDEMEARPGRGQETYNGNKKAILCCPEQ